MPPAAGCTRILVVGAGGFGREVLQWARAAWPEAAERITGFLAADGRPGVGRELPLPIVAGPDTFEPRPGDGLVLAIGIPGVRRRVAESLVHRGAEFLTVIHPTAIVSPTATLGAGSVVCPHAVVSDAARAGRFVLVNYFASLAHDAVAGDFAVLSPYAALGGGAIVADDVFLGLHASVGPGVAVGARSKVAANSCALSPVPPDSIAHGVPARVAPLPG